MRKYERDLKTVLKKVDEDFPGVFEGVDGLKGADLRFLAAKGLVTLHPAGNNELFAEPTAKGRTYFSDKKELAAKSFKNRLLGFICGVATTVTAELLIKYLTSK